MRAYGQYCPIARASEVLGTRWTLIIIRNLFAGCHTIAQIQGGAPGIPKALLRERLRQLEVAGLVRRCPKARGRGSEWHLTDAGLALQPVCDALGQWGSEWLEMGPEHHDPYSVLWSVCRMLPGDAVQADRFLARFEFTDGRLRRLWMLVEQQEAELCIKPPGFEEDVVVQTDCQTLLGWHLGDVTIGQAMAGGRLSVEGRPEAIRVLAGCGGLGDLRGERASATA